MRNGLTKPRLLLLFAEVLALALLAVMATRHYGLSDGLSITVSYLVSYLVPLMLLKRARGTSITAHVLLLALTIGLSIVSFYSLLEWTALDGYSLERPNLSSDARNYYKWALNKFDGSVDRPESVFPGFPLMLVALWKMFGLSVVWPQAMNQMFTLLSVVLTGMTARRLLEGRVKAGPRVLMAEAIALTCLLAYYLMSGISLLKEGTIYLSSAMAAYSLSSMASEDDDRHHLWRDILLFVLACVIAAFVRTTFLYFLGLGLVIMTLPHLRRDWKMSLGLLIILAAFFVLGNHFAAYSVERHVEIASGGWNMQRTFLRNSYYKGLIGYYFLFSPVHRAFMLPLTAVAQFVFPCPWMTNYETPYLLSLIARQSYGWYFVGGTAMFYCLFISWRRHENIGVWTWWAVIIYLGLAYVMGGAMVRYLLPFEPLFVPMALFVICRLFEGRWRKGYAIWMSVIVLIVLMALLVLLEVQQGIISSTFHLPPLRDIILQETL